MNSTSAPIRLLILGGTGEALALAKAIETDARFAAIYSVAGRTRSPRLPKLATRSGGFGGAQALADYLRAENINGLIDATHPFAANISTNALIAARQTGITLIAIRRPAWIAEKGDQWIEVADMQEAAKALGGEPKRVLLTIGQRDVAVFAQVAPQHDYLIRSVEPLPSELLPPRCQSLLERGPFTLDNERELLEKHAIELVLSKNSGGKATAAKLLAARERGIPVVMVARPILPKADIELSDSEQALLYLQKLHEASSMTKRGV